MNTIKTIQSDEQKLRGQVHQGFDKGELPTENMKLMRLGERLYEALLVSSTLSTDQVQSFVQDLSHLKQQNFRDWQADSDFFSPKQLEGLFQAYNMRSGLVYSIDQLIQDHFQGQGLAFHDEYYYRHEDDGSFIGVFHEIRTDDLLRNYHELVEQIIG